MPDRDEGGEIRAPRVREESARCALVDAGATQLELTELLRAASRTIAVRRDGPRLIDLALPWLEKTRKRLAAPQNPEKHLAHLLWIEVTLKDGTSRIFGELREQEIWPGLARDALYALLRPTGSLCANAVNKVHSTARRLIRDALIDDDWKGVNPFAVVPRLRESRPAFPVLTLAQARAMLPKLRRDRFREAMTMLVLGPRPGEIKGLRKVDVDLAERILVWRRSNGRDTTKTGKERRVPIPDQLVPVLAEAMASAPGELVFPDRDGKLQRADAKLSRTLRTALGVAGVVERYDYSCRRKGCGFSESRAEASPEMRCPRCRMKLWCHPIGRQLRWYDLRHSANTLHREAGCDPLVIKLVLGHAVKNVNDDVYTHLSDDFMRFHLNKLAAFCIGHTP